MAAARSIGGRDDVQEPCLRMNDGIVLAVYAQIESAFEGRTSRRVLRMNRTIDHRAAAAHRTSDTLAILDTLDRLAKAQDERDTDGYTISLMANVTITQPIIARRTTKGEKTK